MFCQVGSRSAVFHPMKFDKFEEFVKCAGRGEKGECFFMAQPEFEKDGKWRVVKCCIVFLYV